MSRSLKKGPFVYDRLLKKIEGKRPSEAGVIKVWVRDAVIAPEMVGFTFGGYNGKNRMDADCTEEMVGHRLGEFAPAKRFTRHGGKMQKELEQKAKDSEIAAAKASKEPAKK